eukprot:768538-Pyramimonas_sp.AAC.1
MNASLYVSGAAAKLGSEMTVLACASLFVMVLWLTLEVDTQTLNDMKDATPLVKNVISILQSNWAKAIAVGGLN